MTAKPLINGILWPFRLYKHFWGTRKVLTIVLTCVAVALLTLIFLFTRPTQVQYVTSPVERKDLVQTVEAVGTVISEKDLELKFPMIGIVQDVLVNEGDTVKAGQVLARLRAGTLQADVNSAAASYQNAYANWQRIAEGSRPEDIAIAEAAVESSKVALTSAQTTRKTAQLNLEQSKAELAQLQREADTAVAGQLGSARSALSQQLTAVQNALFAMDDVFNNSIVESTAEYQQSAALDLYEQTQLRAKSDVQAAFSLGTSGDSAAVLGKLRTAHDAANDAVSAIDRGYALVSSLTETQTFTPGVKESARGKIATQRSAVQAALSGLDSATKSLQDSRAGYDTRIAAEQSAITSAQGTVDRSTSDIATAQANLKSQQAQLDLTRAGSRPSEIAAARASVNQAAAQLQRARAQLQDTVIVAPIAGVITRATLKAGEFTGGADSMSNAITMLGDSPFRMELYAAEIDIPRVRIGQSGTVLLDALPNDPLNVRVSEIDSAASDVDNVSKYRVVLDFTNLGQLQPRIGMTGDTTIVTDERTEVLAIPGRAVQRNEDGTEYVKVLTPEDVQVERMVTTGMETDAEVEILTGLQEGENVILLVK